MQELRGVHHRHRDAQHAAGGRVSAQETGFMLLGDLVEFERTQTIFQKPP